MTTDPLIAAARFLQTQLEWLRHATDDQGGPYAVTAYAEIAHCAGRLRGLVNGPAEQKYLGPCGALLPLLPPPEDPAETWVPAGTECQGDIYGAREASRGRCRTCGAEVAQDDRQAWLDGEVRAHAFTATEIGKAYSVNINTIRSWATRGQLIEHGRDRDDRPLYNVGDVLDLAAADAARRETERAKRERRRENAA
jgi:hypothetical protein